MSVANDTTTINWYVANSRRDLMNAIAQVRQVLIRRIEQRQGKETELIAIARWYSGYIRALCDRTRVIWIRIYIQTPDIVGARHCRALRGSTRGPKVLGFFYR